MPRRNILAATSAIALLCGSAAWADLTADQVWQSWNDMYAASGQTLTTASSGRDGDTLVLTGVEISGKTEQGTYTATVGDLRLREMGDGRVEVILPSSFPVKVTGTEEPGTTTEAALTVTQTGASLIVSGAPEDMVYDFAAADVGVRLDSATENGTAVPMNLDLAMKGNAGRYRMTSGSPGTLESQFSADAMTMNVNGKDSEAGGDFTLIANLDGLAGNTNAMFPEGTSFADMEAAAKAGMTMDSSVSIARLAYTLDGVDAQGAKTQGEMVSDGATLSVKLTGDGFDYGAGSKSTKISMATPDLPVPVEGSYGEAAFRFAAPLAQTEEAKPIALLVRLADLTLSDSVWGMFDPGAQLPRDPATVILDLTGTGKLFVDLLDQPEDPAAQPPVPGELESMNLNQLLVKLAGAELTGTGAVTVDNSQGMPKPVGAVDLSLTGGNRLIDTLVAMGVVPEDQAGFARMMLGLYAVPSGEDALTSKIEFKEDGGIYANGQRVF